MRELTNVENEAVQGGSIDAPIPAILDLSVKPRFPIL
jgi:hypothetical protein